MISLSYVSQQVDSRLARNRMQVFSAVCFATCLLLLLVGSARADSIYWANEQNGDIWRANLDGSAAGVIATTDYFAAGIAVHEPTQQVYWTNRGGTIERANLDGSGQQTIVGNVLNPGRIAINGETEQIYWSTGPVINQVGIFSANLDGSEITNIASQIGRVSGIAFDNDQDKLYWTDQVNGRIVAVNYDGTGQTTILSNLHSPIGLSLDSHGRMYWLSYTDS